MGKKKPDVAAQGCACGSGKPYETCCQPYHLGEVAPTPETLMRSRYTAFVLGLQPYLLESWHARTRPESLELDDPVQWLGLEVRQAPPASGDEGMVEFVARYRLQGRAVRLHETSRFLREDGRWYYLDGTFDGAAG